MNVLLFCLTVIATLTIIRGWSRGLVGLVFGLASWIFVIVAVVFGSPVAYDYLMENTSVYDSVYDKVLSSAKELLPDSSAITGDKEKEADETEQAAVSSASGETTKGTSGSNTSGETTKGTSGSSASRETANVTSGTGTSGAASSAADEEGTGDVSEDADDETDEESLADEYGRKGADAKTDLSAVLEDSDLGIDQKAIQAIIKNGNLTELGPQIEKLTKDVTGGVTESADIVREKVCENVAGAITERILRIIAGVFCYLIANIICIIVKIILHILAAPAPIGFLMHLAGAVVGAAEGYIYSMIILLVISQIRFIDVGMRLYALVESSPILMELYTTNPLVPFFENFF